MRRQNELAFVLNTESVEESGWPPYQTGQTPAHDHRDWSVDFRSEDSLSRVMRCSFHPITTFWPQAPSQRIGRPMEFPDVRLTHPRRG